MQQPSVHLSELSICVEDNPHSSLFCGVLVQPSGQKLKGEECRRIMDDTESMCSI